MAKALVFRKDEQVLPLTMKKVDRSRLYGYKEVEVLDENEQKCELATLAEDGRTVIGIGGTAMAYLTVDGDWCERQEIIPVNLEGEEIKPVPSSFSAPIDLIETVSIERYLDHNIRLVYRMDLDREKVSSPEQSEAYDVLFQQLKQGNIFEFPYSYRGGLEADAGFLLMNEANEVFFAVGNKSTVGFVTLQQASTLSHDETVEQDGGGGLMDFDMI